MGEPDESTRKLADRVLSLISVGELSRAANLLQSAGVAEATDATAQLLTPMLSPCPEAEPPDRSWTQRRRHEATGVRAKTFIKTLRDAAKGGASDLAGWRYEHLQASLSKKSSCAQIQAVCSLLARGLLSEEFYSLEAIGRVTPMYKGLKNKLRPLVCGGTWRRLTMSTLCREHKCQFRDYLGDEQYAVGVKAALEKLAATLNVILQQDPSAAVLQIDAVSAFNHMIREAMLEEIEECCPSMLTIFSQWLARRSTVVLITVDGRVVEYTTAIGVDQGCPGSPIAFALGMKRAFRKIRQRLESLLASSDDESSRQARLAILSFLDDVTLVLPPDAVSQAMPVVEEELAAVGLTANFEKSLCWAPSGCCPTGEVAAKLWSNAGRHDGMVLCGCPFEGLPGLDDFSIDSALPVGSTSFVDAFLLKYRVKIQELIDKIVELPTQCSPGRVSIQSANLLLRFCCAQKVNHLTRLLPPKYIRATCLHVDNLMMDAFCKLNGIASLEPWQRTAVTMPLSRGGCGFRALTPTCEAAFVGAWLQSAPHVSRVTGATLSSDASDNVFSNVHEAIRDLEELYGVKALPTLGMSWHDAVTSAREKCQRDLSRAVVSSIDVRWRPTIPSLARAVVDSASSGEGAPGAGDWLLAVPKSRATSIPDDAFVCLIKARLRCDLVPANAHCAYIIQTKKRQCASVLTGPADHAHDCCHQKVHFRHDSMKDKWCSLYRQAGFAALTEQSVPELGPGPAVIADIRAEEGPAAPVRYADVVITHPICCHRGSWCGTGPGTAVAREERGKLKDYLPRPGGRRVLLVPLAFESYGRWGVSAARELRRLARRRAERQDAQQSVDPQAVYRGCLRRWRQEISITLQLGNFAVYSACARGLFCGSDSHLPHDELGTLAEFIVS